MCLLTTTTKRISSLNGKLFKEIIYLVSNSAMVMLKYDVMLNAIDGLTEMSLAFAVIINLKNNSYHFYGSDSLFVGPNKIQVHAINIFQDVPDMTTGQVHTHADRLSSS